MVDDDDHVCGPRSSSRCRGPSSTSTPARRRACPDPRHNVTSHTRTSRLATTTLHPVTTMSRSATMASRPATALPPLAPARARSRACPALAFVALIRARKPAGGLGKPGIDRARARNERCAVPHGNPHCVTSRHGPLVTARQSRPTSHGPLVTAASHGPPVTASRSARHGPPRSAADVPPPCPAGVTSRRQNVTARRYAVTCCHYKTSRPVSMTPRPVIKTSRHAENATSPLGSRPVIARRSWRTLAVHPVAALRIGGISSEAAPPRSSPQRSRTSPFLRPECRARPLRAAAHETARSR